MCASDLFKRDVNDTRKSSQMGCQLCASRQASVAMLPHFGVARQASGIVNYYWQAPASQSSLSLDDCLKTSEF
eukprot:scaffold16470_cov61-Cyclotella_meneghiniana.AAC.2